MHYKGSCHCGRNAFEVDGELQGVVSCNCSICQRKGSLRWFVPRDAFTLTTPEANASEYLFNKHVIEHRFCKGCGIHAYGVGRDRQGKPMAMLNVRCLEGVDIAGLHPTLFDGQHWEEFMAARRAAGEA